MVSQQPQTIIITGGNTGLGYACAESIANARPHDHIILACRNPIKASAAVQTLKKRTGNLTIEALPLDLASLSSVRAFVEEFSALTFPPLQAIICNAGLQIVSGTTYTEDGYETTFAVNHLGHFLLVNLLLPLLSPPARIVFVSSGTHDPDQHTGLPAPHYRGARALAWPDRYPDPDEASEDTATIGRRRYATSKLCNILCTYELARRLAAPTDTLHNSPASPITVNAFDPGMMPGSGLARDYDPLRRFAWNYVLPIFSRLNPQANSIHSSAQFLAQLVLDEQLTNITGKYFARDRPIRSSATSYDQSIATELWETSAELVGITQ